MKKNVLVVALALSLSACGVIETGNVGVRTTFGTVSMEEELPGFYWAILSSMDEFTAKEIPVELTDLTPKAKDNLSLRDLDIIVYYKVAQGAVAETLVKYSNQSAADANGIWYPAFNLVRSIARNQAYKAVANVESLVIHTQRDALATAIHDGLQAELNRSDPGVFTITLVVVRAITTDPSIEQSIQAAVARQKELEAMAVQENIAKKQASIEITRAQGMAEANRIINQSLTREYLQHEANEVMRTFAEKGNTNTVILPANTQIAPLINLK